MKSMLNKSFNHAKCKTAIKLAESRIKLLRNKKGIQLAQLKREVAQLLSSGQHLTAMIRVEHVIREEKTIAAYDLIETYSALIMARLPIIESQKICPIDLKEAVTSIIFAAPRCTDIPELKDVSKHFTAKYGKDFVSSAIELRPDSGVNRSLVEKLSVRAPDDPSKVKVLSAIAQENNIKREPNWFEEKEPETPFLKVSDLDKGNKIHVGHPDLQAAHDFESHHRVSSNILGTAHDVQGAPSFEPRQKVTSSGIEHESVQSNRFSTTEARFEDKPIHNMLFKDAADAANAAARSAEEASTAAKAAAELASRGKNMNYTCAASEPDFDYAHNEVDHEYKAAAFRRDPFKGVIFSPSEPGMEEDMQRDANSQEKSSETVGGDSFKRDQSRSAHHNRHNSVEQRNPRKQAEHKKNGRGGKGSPKKDYYQSVEQYEDEDLYETDCPGVRVSPRQRSRSQSGSADFIETSSYANHQRTGVEYPFTELTGKTKTVGSGSQYDDIGEDYGVHPKLNVPKYNDDPSEDPFTVVFHERKALEEDKEVKEPSNHVAATQFSVVYSNKDEVYSDSDPERYGFEPRRVPSDPPFNSSPDHSRSTRSHERQSSSSAKNQAELAESFDSSLLSQLDKPLPLNFDSDDGEDVSKFKDGKKYGSVGVSRDSSKYVIEPDLTSYSIPNAECRPELNLEFLPRGRRNVGYSRLPYANERLESSKQSHSTGQKHPSMSHYLAGYDPKKDDDRYLGTGNGMPSLKYSGAYLDSDESGSQDEGPRETVLVKGGRVVPGVTRRSRVSTESAEHSKPESVSSYEVPAATLESVPEKESPSSARSCNAFQRAELLRWAETQTEDKPTHQLRDENAVSSVDEKGVAYSAAADGRRAGGRSARTGRGSSGLPRIEIEACNEPTNEPEMSAQEENSRPTVEKKQATNSKAGS